MLWASVEYNIQFNIPLCQYLTTALALIPLTMGWNVVAFPLTKKASANKIKALVSLI